MPSEGRTAPRHRLLLQSKVGEGAGAVEVDDDARHLATAHVENMCLVGSDLDAAGLAASTIAHHDQETSVVKLADGLCCDLEVLPGSERFPHPPRHGAQANRGARIRTFNEHELDLGVCPLRRAEIAASDPA